MTIQEIKDLFILHPNKMNKGAAKLAERFGVSKEDIYKIKEEVKELLCNNTVNGLQNIIAEQEEFIGELIKKVDNNKGTLESTTESIFEPKNDIELAELHKIDLTKYKISNYWSKLKSNGKFTSSVLATLRKVENDLPLQKDVILNEIKEYVSSSLLTASFDYFTNSLNEKPKKGNKMLEISIPDPHFGKLSWREETGEDYDLKIATKRYKDAILHLLQLANLDEVTEIVLPIGNDMFNVENNSNFTTAGTPQDCDSRFHKMVKTVKEILIETITGLSAIANVRVVIVPGNHDMSTMFMMGEILESYFHNIPNVNIDNTPTLRKYVQFGKCGFQYTHGNEEKHGDLGLIFATEQPHLWAATEFRFAKLGHFHKSKTLSYVSLDSYQGFQIQILPSLSGSDFWHNKKGYISQKQAKAFLYDPEYGEIANYTYTI